MPLKARSEEGEEEGKEQEEEAEDNEFRLVEEALLMCKWSLKSLRDWSMRHDRASEYTAKMSAD